MQAEEGKSQLCACVCVCVRERERDRDSERLQIDKEERLS